MHAASVREGRVVRTPGRAGRIAAAILIVLLSCVFIALGTWQLHRRHWKHDLIARVTQRVHAHAAIAPGPQRWPGITVQSDEYRHVSVTGSYLHEHTVLVQAVTDLGAGFWMLTPLRSTQGWLVLVNRGFVASRTADAGPAQSAASVRTVTGLLRLSEPGGGFLRKNVAAAGRWYSRDVAAIAAAQGLGDVAPYFIDADAAATGATSGLQPGPGNLAAPAARNADSSVAPIGGLTVIAFSDNHMVYALTWYALALMAAAAGVWLQMAVRRLAPQATRGTGEAIAGNGVEGRIGNDRAH